MEQTPDLTELYNQGIAHFQSGDIPAASRYFHDVVELNPNHSPAWNNLGVCAFQENHIDDARSYFQKACETDPENMDAITNLADLSFSEKHFSDAVKLYTLLAQKNPEKAEYHVRLGDCYVSFGEYNSAYTCYKEAAQHEPENEFIKERLSLLVSALSPVPFTISQSYLDLPPRAGFDAGSEHIADLFKKAKFKTISLEEPFNSTDFQSTPLEIIIVKDNISIYKENLPALCRILILDSVPETIDLTKNEKIRNIDYVFCTSAVEQKLLLDKHEFAAYQIRVFDAGKFVIETKPEAILQRFFDYYAEMVLFYAQRLELKSCLEQVFRLLKKSTKILPDKTEISEYFEEIKEKIDHLFNPGSYKKLYDSAAQISLPQYNAAPIARFGWILNQLKSTPNLHSLLDVGCHKGEYCFALANKGYSMTGIDIAEKNIEEAQKHLSEHKEFAGKCKFQVSPADQMDELFPGSHFDGALLMELLEHVPDIENVLQSVEKIMKPGGYIFITVPCTHLEMINNIIFQKSTDFPEHVRCFSTENIPVYFKNKKEMFWEEIAAESGTDKQKWFGIRYQV